MKVFIIRHGEVEPEYNAQGERIVYGPNAPLAKLGEIQIKKLGDELKRQGIHLDAIYSSPYKRARQSAQILQEELGVFPVHLEDDLQDVFPNSGEGKSFAQVAEVSGDIYAHPLGPEQETLIHLSQRARAAMKNILVDSKNRGYNAVGITSHGDLISALGWSLTHPESPSSYDEMTRALFLEKGEAYACSFNNFMSLEGRPRIISVDEVKKSIETFRK